MGPKTTYQDLLIPVVRSGQRVVDLESLDSIRTRVRSGLLSLSAPIRRLDCVAGYPVKLEQRLAAQKESLIAAVDNRD